MNWGQRSGSWNRLEKCVACCRCRVDTLACVSAPVARLDNKWPLFNCKQKPLAASAVCCLCLEQQQPRVMTAATWNIRAERKKLKRDGAKEKGVLLQWSTEYQSANQSEPAIS